MSAELAFKLAEDVDQGVLMKLDNFLELANVKAQGVTKVNADLLVIPSPLHLVANTQSKSSPICLVVALIANRCLQDKVLTQDFIQACFKIQSFKRFCSSTDFHLVFV